jgi:hypothetical protein
MTSIVINATAIPTTARQAIVNTPTREMVDRGRTFKAGLAFSNLARQTA